MTCCLNAGLNCIIIRAGVSVYALRGVYSNYLSFQGAKPIFTMGRFDKMSYNVRYCGCKESAACAFLRGCIYIPERMCAIICDGVPEALSLRGEDDYF